VLGFELPENPVYPFIQQFEEKNCKAHLLCAVSGGSKEAFAVETYIFS